METVFEVAYCCDSSYEGHVTLKAFRSLDDAIQYVEDYIQKHEPEWKGSYREFTGGDDDSFTLFGSDYRNSPIRNWGDDGEEFAWIRRYWVRFYELCIREVELV